MAGSTPFGSLPHPAGISVFGMCGFVGPYPEDGLLGSGNAYPCPEVALMIKINLRTSTACGGGTAAATPGA